MATNHVVLLTQDAQDQIQFKQIYSVGSQYVGQALDMARVFQDAINPETLYFDFSKAIQIVKEHPEMAVVATVNQTISQQDSQVSAMVDKVIELLNTVLGVVLTDGQKAQYTTAIENAFTNLSTQEGGAWIFYQSEEANKTTYQYNILFAVQNEETGSVMLALPIGMTITVEVDKKQVLFITLKDKHNYNVQVQAIQVVEPLKG